MRIGAHVPVAGGLPGAVDYAVETGCETIQVFAKSPRQWKSPKRDPEEAAAFREGCAARGVFPVFSHASYLINLGADDPEQWAKSIAALADELDRAALIGAAGVVCHLGRRFADGEDECVARVVETVVRAYDLAQPGAPAIVLENSAGAGRQFGVTPDELAVTLNAVRAAGVPAALCFDTCHGLAAGIDVRGSSGWDILLDRLDELCGPPPIVLIHANDCKGDLGSHKDRHEWIGDGCMGEAGFSAMFADPRLAEAAAICEMPGEVPVKDVENVRRLKRLRDGDAASGDPGPASA
ncbi:MAG: deoxyribonuclease IV [Coriobacteriia bacterium]|nr:deoxyribonuclease IV [Coriobacteriia bacterium]